jgi:26S proteasome regulatory subunit N3
LESEEDAEYVVGKAIRDGVIEASIIHERGWMVQRGYEIEGASGDGPGSKATFNLGGRSKPVGEALVRSEGQGGLMRGYGPEVVDVFGRRIAFCLQLHNESVRVNSHFSFLFTIAQLLLGYALSS